MWLILGCALHVTRTGLVERPEAGVVHLVEPGGERVALTLGAEGESLRYLYGTVVAIDGSRVGGRLRVRDWYVVDAGDGSSGWVGTLRVTGLRVLINDRNTRRTYVVDDQNSAPLRAYGGRQVLLLGHLSGPETVTPVAWRLLEPE